MVLKNIQNLMLILKRKNKGKKLLKNVKTLYNLFWIKNKVVYIFKIGKRAKNRLLLLKEQSHEIFECWVFIK